MKIAIVSVEDGLMSVGVRKMTAFVRTLNEDTTLHFVPYGNYRSLMRMLRYMDFPEVPDDSVREMAEALARADIVGFSSMTGYSRLTSSIIRHVRAINPKAYVIWGGIHPIIVPDDAIEHADAICIGEGEFAFREFFERYREGRDFTQTRNFWFRRNGEIVKNGFLPLMTSEDMTSLPLPNYRTGEVIYEPGRGYVPVATRHYIRYDGLSYNTVWSIGCPFKCTFCGNTKFIENDNAYRRIRHPSVAYLLEEIAQARRANPHVSTVIFHDDSFMALPLKVLAEFSEEYKKNVGLPFCVYGLIPNYVRRDKLELLLAAGLNRVRMGIQNGSERILEFYDRPTPPWKIREAAQILSDYSRYMIPPAYDIILDNPIETREDVTTNLDFLYDLARPFTMNLFSLRMIPNTIMERQMAERKISIDEVSSNYYHNHPTLANCLAYLIATFRPPRWLFRAMRERSHPFTVEQRSHPVLMFCCRVVYLGKRWLDHFRFMDFSMTGGRLGYFLWKIGLVGFWSKRVVRIFEPETRV